MSQSRKISRAFDNMITTQISTRQPSQSPSQETWTTPHETLLKCNFDAGLHPPSLQSTGGWIIRDKHGQALTWGSARLGFVLTPLEAETRALLAAIQQCWIRGYTNVCFEGDCQTLINIINGLTSNAALSNLIQDNLFWSSKFKSVMFSFTKRSSNQAAHSLAKYGCISSIFYSNFVSQPLWLKNNLCNDFRN